MDIDLRKIDALIAEKVMGLEPWPEQDPRWKVKAFKAPIVLPHQTPKPCEPPNYSTDISAAFTIRESPKLQGLKFRIESIEVIENGVRSFNWYASFGEHSAVSHVLPAHAICLAALKAVGEA